MVNTKISALPTATALGTADSSVIVQGGVTKRAPLALLPIGAPTSAPPDPAISQTWLSNAWEHVTADPAPGARYKILPGQEMSVVRANGRYNMIFNGPPSIAYSWCAETADPRIASNWSAPVQVLTRPGHGIVHGSLYIEGTTAYYYFVDSTDQKVYVATANTADFTTWIDAGTYITGPIKNTDTYVVTGNVNMVKNGATYYLFVEAAYMVTDAVGNVSPWLTTVLTSSSPTSGFAVNNSTFLSSLRPNGNTGSVSGPCIQAENGKWTMIYHGTSWLRAGLPTDLYRATTTDLSADAWTLTNGGHPMMTRAHPLEVDQVADPEVCAGPDGTKYLFYTAVDNTTGLFSVMCTRLNPTLCRYTNGVWAPAEALQGGEAPYNEAFNPRVLQNVPHLDPTGQAAVGTWGLTATPAGMYGGAARTNTTAALNDSVAFDVTLTPGTYTLRLVYPTGPDRGICTIDLAYGGKYYILTVGTVDQYTATATPNQAATFTFTIGGWAPARAQVRFKSTGKNAASTGYQLADQGWKITRTDY